MKLTGKKFLSLCFFSLSFYFSMAQGKTFADYVSINGYIKELSTIAFVQDGSTFSLSHLIHNRINLSIKPVSHFTIFAALRTRILISNEPLEVPGFVQQYGQDNGIIKMSYTNAKDSIVVFTTILDRLYLDWSNDKWDLRLGRQRLNWGVNLTWNPNDIFNTYNFLDFDYEERPGADAAKVEYNFTSFSNLEVAFSPSRSANQMIGAAKYSFNTHGYDLQFLAGNYYTGAVAGLGWAGNIKDAGFKGEISYFQDWNDTRFKTVDVSFSPSFDYNFKGGWYVNGSVLYNNAATDKLYSEGQLLSENLSPKMLMPAKYNFMVSTTKQYTPILNGGFAVVYSPIINLFIFSPTLSVNLATNWDADIIIYTFFADNAANKFEVLGNEFNFRIRWSFSN